MVFPIHSIVHPSDGSIPAPQYVATMDESFEERWNGVGQGKTRNRKDKARILNRVR